MRFVDPPTLPSPWRERPDDLDGLLSAFFRSETPTVWPAPPGTEESLPLSRPMAAPRPSRWNSRYALAASIALLLAGGWFLSGMFQDLGGNGSSRTITDETATTEDGRPVRVRTKHLGSGTRQVEVEEINAGGKDDTTGNRIKDDVGLPRD